NGFRFVKSRRRSPSSRPVTRKSNGLPEKLTNKSEKKIRRLKALSMKRNMLRRRLQGVEPASQGHGEVSKKEEAINRYPNTNEKYANHAAEYRHGRYLYLVALEDFQSGIHLFDDWLDSFAFY